MLWCNPLAAIQMDYLEIHPSKAPWMGIFRPEILSGERIWKPGLHPHAQWLLMDRNQAFLHSLCKMLFLDGLITKGVSLISVCHNVATEACTFSMEHKHGILCAVSSVLLLESGHPPFLKNCCAIAPYPYSGISIISPRCAAVAAFLRRPILLSPPPQLPYLAHRTGRLVPCPFIPLLPCRVPVSTFSCWPSLWTHTGMRSVCNSPLTCSA